MAVNMVTLPEPESGTKRPKLTTPKYGAFAMVLSAEKYCEVQAFGYCEVLIWFRDSLLGVVIRWCDRPRTNISQENVLTTIIAKCHFRA